MVKRTGNERRSRTEQTARAWDLLMDLLVSFLPILGMVQNLLRKILQKWILVTAIYILQKGRVKHDRLRKMSRPVRYLSAILFFVFSFITHQDNFRNLSEKILQTQLKILVQHFVQRNLLIWMAGLYGSNSKITGGNSENTSGIKMMT